MAFIGPWGTFLHIPKTGGTWLRKALRLATTNDWDDFQEIGYIHGLPRTLDYTRPIFTLVRHPVPWVRSLWAHRCKEKWAEMEADGSVYNSIAAVIQPFASFDFEDFTTRLYDGRSLFVTWAFSHFFIPGVDRVPLERVYTYFKETQNLDLTGVEIANASKDLPPLTDDLRRFIQNRERPIIDLFYRDWPP